MKCGQLPITSTGLTHPSNHTHCSICRHTYSTIEPRKQKEEHIHFSSVEYGKDVNTVMNVKERANYATVILCIINIKSTTKLFITVLTTVIKELILLDCGKTWLIKRNQSFSGTLTVCLPI